MLTPYPKSFPSDAISSLITMIRDKDVDKSAMGLAIWNLQGYAQSMLLTNTTQRYATSSNPNPSDEDALEALKVLDLNKDNLNKDNLNKDKFTQTNPIISIALSVLLKWILNRLTAM